MTELMSVWSTIGSVALAILILLIMITVHEFGHYVAGKILKFKIDEFSVGFGPPLFKITLKKSGELFAVRLIPLGGYCAFHGEDGLEEEQTQEQEPPAPFTELEEASDGGAEKAESGTEHVELTPAHSERSEESHGFPVHSERSEESHGPMGDSVQGDASAPPQHERIDEGSSAHSERSEESHGFPVHSERSEESHGFPVHSERSEESHGTMGDFVQGDVSATPQHERETEPPKRHWTDDGSFTNMKPWKRIIVLIAGAAMNYLLALLFILIEFFSYGQSVIQIRGVEPSEEWGTEFCFREGDLLLGAEGRSFYLTTDVAAAINHRAAGDKVTFTVSRIQEDGSRREETVEIVLRNAVEVNNSADFTGVWGALGVGIETREDGNRYYMLETASYRFGFFATLGRSFAYSFKLAGSIFQVIGELFTGQLGLDALGGPVTTIRMTSQIASQGFRNFLEISALIGVNLAVFNLLPIPALDGSKVVFTAIEWIRGKPISRKVEAVIHAVGFLLLIGFAILVDILQFV